jgi:hypothetical protein
METKQQDTTKGAEPQVDATKAEGSTAMQTTVSSAPALSPEMLAMMQKDSGKQSFKVREMMIPIMKIANTTTGIFKKSHADYIPGIEEGDISDTLTRVIYKPPVKLIFVRFETVYIESKPEMGPTVKLWGGDRSGYDAASGRDVGTRITKDGNEIREVGQYYTMLVQPNGMVLPSMIYLGSTAWKEARRLNTLLGNLELMGPDGPFVAPPYARMFEGITVPEKNEKNSWFAWKFNMGKLTLMEENGLHLYKRAKSLEEAIDKNETRIVGTADDDRFAADQQTRRRSASSSDSGPPRDDAPPPEGEDDYGGGPSSHQQATQGKAKDAPF